ncbi:MAG: helix-turn-helix domain-containing protein [Opitutae bacterium]|nr:helix-turn-helix domain-containing protein [Opitutae bacterium]
MKKSFGDRLRERRGSRSQAEMANVFGVSQSAYSAWERGAKEPSISTIGSICREFNVSADWLLGLPTASSPSIPSAPVVPPDAASAPSEAYWRGLAASQQETIAGLTRLLAAASKPTVPAARCGGGGATKSA